MSESDVGDVRDDDRIDVVFEDGRHITCTGARMKALVAEGHATYSAGKFAFTDKGVARMIELVGLSVKVADDGTGN